MPNVLCGFASYAELNGRIFACYGVARLIVTTQPSREVEPRNVVENPRQACDVLHNRLSIGATRPAPRSNRHVEVPCPQGKPDVRRKVLKAYGTILPRSVSIRRDQISRRWAQDDHDSRRLRDSDLRRGSKSGLVNVELNGEIVAVFMRDIDARAELLP
jgi:hypothetical protein